MFNENKLIGERIKFARERAGLTLEELGKSLSLNKSTILRYEAGEVKKIKLPILQAIAQRLDVSPEWLSIKIDKMESFTEFQTKHVTNLFSSIPTMMKKPRLGVISCGEPIMSEENFDGYDDVPESINCDFTLMCEGDSMIGARILDGDIVFIKQQPIVENGEIAAILIDGTEKLLKRIYMTDSSITLQAENPKYAPMVFVKEDMNRVAIIGKAVGFYSLIK